MQTLGSPGGTFRSIPMRTARKRENYPRNVESLVSKQKDRAQNLGMQTRRQTGADPQGTAQSAEEGHWRTPRRPEEMHGTGA